MYLGYPWGAQPVSPQLSEGNAGTKGGSQAQDQTLKLGKHGPGWTRLWGMQPWGLLAAPPEFPTTFRPFSLPEVALYRAAGRGGHWL